MDIRPYPKLKNRDSGTVIEINANPFSIGRGLSCNYVLPNRTVSRVHCMLEMDSENNWVFKDTSTNGTYINQELVKKGTSPPLKNNDVISLDNTGLESYTFYMDDVNDDITDEQLCAIADSVLDEVEYFSSNPIVVPNSSRVNPTNEALGAPGLSLRRNTTDSTTSDPLQDHLYTAKSSAKGVKRPRVTRSPRPTSDPVVTSRDTTTNDSCGNTIAGSIPESAVSSVPATSNFSVDLPLNGGLGVVEDSVQALSASAGVGDGGGNSERSDGVRSESQTSDSSNRTVFRDDTEAVVPPTENTGSCTRPMEVDVPAAEPGPSKSKKEKDPPVEDRKAELKVHDKEMQDQYEDMENELQCVICSELFIKALTLNCSHTFCKYCITMWSKNKSDCPICRTKITSMTSTIVLDNVIDKMIENSNEEIKTHRQTLLEERKKQEQAEKEPPPPPADRAQTRQAARRGRNARGRGGTPRRGRGGNRAAQDAPRINVLDPVAINIGALVNNVIEVSSDSDWSSDTDSMSPNDQDEYDNDEWYNRRRPFYGGYGYCFRCGSPSHWANNCPNR